MPVGFFATCPTGGERRGGKAMKGIYERASSVLSAK